MPNVERFAEAIWNSVKGRDETKISCVKVVFQGGDYLLFVYLVHKNTRNQLVTT